MYFNELVEVLLKEATKQRAHEIVWGRQYRVYDDNMFVATVRFQNVAHHIIRVCRKTMVQPERKWWQRKRKPYEQEQPVYVYDNGTESFDESNLYDIIVAERLILARFSVDTDPVRELQERINDMRRAVNAVK